MQYVWLDCTCSEGVCSTFDCIVPVVRGYAVRLIVWVRSTSELPWLTIRWRCKYKIFYCFNKFFIFITILIFNETILIWIFFHFELKWAPNSNFPWRFFSVWRRQFWRRKIKPSKTFQFSVAAYFSLLKKYFLIKKV